MLLLTGEYSHTIDNKGRVLISNKLRNQIDEEENGSNFYLVLGVNNVLCLYPEKYYERIVLAEGPAVTAPDEWVAFERMSGAFTNRVELDSQGRILLSDKLRKRAGLTENITLVGVRDHIEIWNNESWQAYVEDHMEQYQKQMMQARQIVLYKKDEVDV